MATKLLTAQELAERLKIKDYTVLDYARRGIIPSVKIGSVIRFRWSDVLAAGAEPTEAVPKKQLKIRRPRLRTIDSVVLSALTTRS